jgi:hypothetical protein
VKQIEIIEPDAVNAADARRLKQVAGDRRVQRAANERIDGGEDALWIGRGEDVELDERRLPSRELFGEDGNGVASRRPSVANGSDSTTRTTTAAYATCSGLRTRAASRFRSATAGCSTGSRG